MRDRMRPRLVGFVVAAFVLVMASVPAAVSARTPVDPATLTPPPPAEFNPVCERIGNQIICEVSFSDPPIVEEPSEVICGSTELLVSQTRSVVGKRFYSADGFLLRRHFHDKLAGAWTNPLTGESLLLAGGFTYLHDLGVPGDISSGTTRITGSVRIYSPDGRTILHGDAGRLVIDESTGMVTAESGQHPFEDYFARGDVAALQPLCAALGL
jgi:hypothetical protein